MLPYRCSRGMWWRNRKPATPWPTTNIWSGAWRDWGNTLAGRVTWIPGSFAEDRSKEGRTIMGHRHWQVGVHSRLQHRRIGCTVLRSKTGCLSMRHTGLRAGWQARRHSNKRKIRTHGGVGVVSKQMWRQTSLLDLCSCLCVEGFVWEVQRPDAAHVQTRGEVKVKQMDELWSFIETAANVILYGSVLWGEKV